VTECTSRAGEGWHVRGYRKANERLSRTSKETIMKTSILTIAAAAVAVTAIGFTAPASATPLSAAGQMLAQDLDNQIIEVGRRGGGKKWGGGQRHGKHWGGGRRHGKKWGHKRHRYHGYHAPYYYGGCFQQAHVLVGGFYVLKTINVC
jgi:hypothetical protein